MYGGATITALIEYMMSAEARDKFNRDCLAHPEHSVEALASWLREGMKEAGVAVGVDAVQAVVSQACKLLVSKAALLQGALAEYVPHLPHHLLLALLLHNVPHSCNIDDNINIS
jgi:hypothetical protein